MQYPASGPVGNHAPPPRGTTCLHFDMCAMALETQPLPAVLHAHSPAKLTNCPAASDVGGQQFLGPSSGADRPLCFSGRAPTLAPLGRFVMFRTCHRLLCRLGPHIGREQHRGPASDHLPPPCPTSDRTPTTLVKGMYFGKIESLDRDWSGNCDSRPGNAISRELTSPVCILAQIYLNCRLLLADVTRLLNSQVTTFTHVTC